MVGKILRIAAIVLFCMAIVIVVAALICTVAASIKVYVCLFAVASLCGLLSYICSQVATMYFSWCSEQYDAFIKMLVKIFKIAAIVAIGATIVFVVVGIIYVQFITGPIDWLPRYALVGVIITAVFYTAAKVLNISSAHKSTVDRPLSNKPIMIGLGIIGMLVFLCGVLFVFWVYIFASSFI